MPRLNLERLPAGPMIAGGMVLLLAIGWLDHRTGPYISFAIFYLPPIALVAWFGGKWFGILAALEGAAIWFAADYFAAIPISFLFHLWNAFARFTIFLIAALFVRSVCLQLTGLQKSLNQKTKEVETFHRLLPICSYCKRIRDEQGNWQQLEVYVRDRMDMEFSHSICPDCAEEHHGN